VVAKDFHEIWVQMLASVFQIVDLKALVSSLFRPILHERINVGRSLLTVSPIAFLGRIDNVLERTLIVDFSTGTLTHRLGYLFWVKYHVLEAVHEGRERVSRRSRQRLSLLAMYI
jgi:hypothetical protein